MKYCILTLGCKVNSYESEFIKEKFEEKGYMVSQIKDDPDVVVVNTCSVTNQSDAKSRHMIRLVRRECPNAILIVCGCSAQNHRENLLELNIDILLGNKDKSRIVELVEKFKIDHQKTTTFYDLSNTEFEDMMLKSERDKTRAFVKIQDGCDNFCAYCIIPFLRGNIRNKDIDIAEREISCLVEMGHREIVLTGIHTGSYGRGTPYDLVDLIRRISLLPKLDRIRISSIEITELDDKFMQELASNQKICDHLHIPIQSGSDNVLAKMNRKYDMAFYKKKIEEIRSIRPNISITTDLIVGFPYESDECFEETVTNLREIGFTKIHTFPFSLRSGTKAEEMSEHFVQEAVKKERVHRILELSREQESAYYCKFIGQVLDIIVETSKDGRSTGHTSNYILVTVDGELEEGKTYLVKIVSVDGPTVNGTVENIE